MAAQSKLELILEMKNKMKAPLAKVRSNVRSSVSEMKGDLSSIKTEPIEKPVHIKEVVNSAKIKPIPDQTVTIKEVIHPSDLKPIPDQIVNVKEVVIKADIKPIPDQVVNIKEVVNRAKIKPIPDQTVNIRPSVNNSLISRIKKKLTFRDRSVEIKPEVADRSRIRNWIDRTTDYAKRKFSDIRMKVQEVTRNPFSKLESHADSFRMRTVKAFSAIREEVPGLSRALEVIGNPYVLAIAGSIALATATTKLGSHLFDVTSEIKESQKTIRAIFGITEEAMLRQATSRTMSISAILNVDQSELVTSANAIRKEYGLAIADSLDLVKRGIQSTNGLLELNEIREYASQMKAAGLSAQEFIALSAIGKKEGIYDDKAVDAVKEFNLRIREMTPAAKDALSGIGISSSAILKGLDTGSLRTIDVIRQVSTALGTVGTQARQTAIADLFGGPGEDAGERFLLGLSKMDFSIRGISAGMQGIISHQDQQILLNENIRDQQQTIAAILNPVRKQFEILKLRAQELFYKTIASGMSWIRENSSLLVTGLKILRDSLIGVTVAIAAIKGPAVISFLAIKAGAAISALSSWTLAGSLRAVGVAIKMIPGIGWLLAIIGAIVTAYHTSDTFRASIHGVVASLKELLKLAAPIGRMMAGLVTGNYTEIGLGFQDLKKAWGSMDFKGAYRNAYNEVMDDARKRREEEKGLTPKSIEQNAALELTGEPDSPLGAGGKPGQVQGTTPDLSLDTIETSSQRIQNLTVNIEAFHKGDNLISPDHEGQQLTLDDVEKWFNDMSLRLVRNIETSAG